MKSSEIVDPMVDPLSLLSQVSYGTNSPIPTAYPEGTQPSRKADTTVYEFPGDLSYLAYLESH